MEPNPKLNSDTDLNDASPLKWTNGKQRNGPQSWHDNKTQFLGYQSTRIASVNMIAHFLGTPTGARSAKMLESGADLLNFGVYTGGGIRRWLDELSKHHLNFTGRVLGFDSSCRYWLYALALFLVIGIGSGRRH